MKLPEKCDVYREAYFSQKMFTNGLNCLKNVGVTIVSRPEMVDSFNTLILVYRKHTKESIYKQFGISVST